MAFEIAASAYGGLAMTAEMNLLAPVGDAGPGGFGGLTISLDGGLEKFREFFFSRAISSRSVSIWLFKKTTVSRSCRFSSTSRASMTSLSTMPAYVANRIPEPTSNHHTNKKNCERTQF